MYEDLRPFFHPRGVVVIGTSSSPSKLGFGVARNLVASKFEGAIHFVSNKPGELFGKVVYSKAAEIPDPVDLAVIVVPATAVPQALRDCADRGIQNCIIESAGFREAGTDGAALEAECAQIARQRGLRLIGPNCIGTIDTGFPLDTSFLQPPMPPRGSIGFASQSGAFCASIIDWSRGQGFGFSQIVSLGNQADVAETEALGWLADHDQTKVITLYMESVRNGREFVLAAREVGRRIPIVALKTGRSEAGKRAAASHTAAMAGADHAFTAALEKAGILRAETAQDMFDWARAFAACPLPKGRRVAILTNSGGPGVAAVDLIEKLGMYPAQLSDYTHNQLAKLLPSAANTSNPVDMLAGAGPKEYSDCLRILLDDPGVDSLVMILPPPPMWTAESIAEAVAPIIMTARKPVLVALMGQRLVAEARLRFDASGIACYPFAENAVSALGALARYSEFRQKPVQESDKLLRDALRASDSYAVLDLEAYQIHQPKFAHARSAIEAASLASAIGFPVVLKISSPDILHKSDVQGVLRNIHTEESVTDGYAQLLAAARDKAPSAHLEGVSVHQQAGDGQDLIMGFVQDPSFGPLMMFGSGGIEAEGLGDVAFALAPLSEAEADDLISRTWAGRRLRGYRNIPAADMTAVRAALLGVSRLASEHPEIREMEINPLRAMRNGALALDVRIVK